MVALKDATMRAMTSALGEICLGAASMLVPGIGRTIYLGVYFVVRHVLAESGIEPLVTGLPDTVEVARRGDILTVISHGDGPVSAELPGNDLVTHVKYRLGH